jgi:hypothetical protein
MVLEMNAHKNRGRARIMCVSPAGESGGRKEKHESETLIGGLQDQLDKWYIAVEWGRQKKAGRQAETKRIERHAEQDQIQ